MKSHGDLSFSIIFLSFYLTFLHFIFTIRKKLLYDFPLFPQLFFPILSLTLPFPCHTLRSLLIPTCPASPTVTSIFSLFLVLVPLKCSLYLLPLSRHNTINTYLWCYIKNPTNQPNKTHYFPPHSPQTTKQPNNQTPKPFPPFCHLMIWSVLFGISFSSFIFDSQQIDFCPFYHLKLHLMISYKISELDSFPSLPWPVVFWCNSRSLIHNVYFLWLQYFLDFWEKLLLCVFWIIFLTLSWFSSSVLFLGNLIISKFS